MNIPLLILIITCAAFIQTSAGFGFSMVALSILTFFLPLLTGSVIAVLAMLPLTLFVALKTIKDINWDIFFLPFVFSIITTQIGIRLLMVTDNGLLLRLLGIALIGFSLFSFMTNSTLKLKSTFSVKLLFGTLSGLFSGLFNMGGPPIAIYMLSSTKSKEEYNSTLQIYFLATTSIAIVTHLLYGNITKEILWLAGYAYIGVFIGTLFGRILFKKLSSEKMGKLVYGVMMIMGCVVLFRI
jgi:uncharacterized membrane protein YfcA